MDKQILKKKLKKYLFFISIVFLSITSIHLVYSFIYFDSKQIPQKWGTISESFVWKFPHLNPLKFSTGYNSYINNILYRSLLTYDINNNKIIWDLATCNIENTRNIKCELAKNTKWSSGESITAEDIVFTYRTIKKHNTNPVMKSILDNITITYSDSSILFTSNINDVNILNILFQPILPKKVIKQIDEKDLTKAISPINWIYSWKYKISKVDQNEIVWFKRIFLEKNIFYTKNPIYIENITLKIYKNYPSLLQQRDSINIFHDVKNLIWNSIPRLKSHKYILPQYVWVFINRDKIEYPNIRNYILSQIDPQKIVEAIWVNNNRVINSPFLNDLNLNIKQSNITLKTMLNSLWYHKKDFYLYKISNQIESKKISWEAKIQNINIKENSNTWITLKNNIQKINISEIKNSITIDNYNTKSKIIKSPSWVDRYNFITNPNITFKWISGKNVTDIYINDYKLQNFKPKTGKFSYRLSPDLWNIKLWENNYKIYFVINWEKIFKEKITLFHDKSRKNLEKKEIDLIANLINEKIKLTKKEIAYNKEKKKKTKEEILSYDYNKKRKLNAEKIEKQNLIKNLDEGFFYNKNFEAFTLNLSFIEWSREIYLAAKEVKKLLEESGIKINLTSIKNKDLQKQLKENKEEYHILLAWVNLWYFTFNLSKIFYSGQIEKWKNFSKIRGSKFDSILEDLKSVNINDKQKIRELEKAVIATLEKENIFKPLYSPYHSNLVSKNIEWYKLPYIIPSHIYRFQPLIKSYILKEKIINNEWKNISWFIKYLINNLF